MGALFKNHSETFQVFLLSYFTAFHHQFFPNPYCKEAALNFLKKRH